MFSFSAFAQAVESFSGGCSTGGSATAGTCSAAIGEGATASGNESVALGIATSSGDVSYSFGVTATAAADTSVAIGKCVETDASETNNIVIGIGAPGIGLVNDISWSMMFGVNSNVSTVYIDDSGGTIGSYGNVGIGNITSPSSLLHVRDQLRVGYDSEDNGSIVFNNSSNDKTVTFKSGVTTTTHEYTLPLEQGDNGDVLTNNGSGVLSWVAPGTASDSWLIGGNAGTNASTNFLGTTDNVDLVFRTNDVEEMRIKANGSVGIGTSTPVSLLHLETGTGSNTVLTLAAASNQSRMVEFRENGAVAGWLRQFGGDDRIEFRNSMSGRDIRLSVNVGTVGGTGTQTNALTIDGDNGFVGIGANFNTPSFQLDVRAEDSTSTAEVISRFRVEDDDDSFVRIENRSSNDNEFAPWVQGSSATTAFAALELTARVQDAGNSGTTPGMIFSTLREDFEDPVSRPLFSWKSNATHMEMDANGDLGIGTTAPQGRLHVNGTLFANLSFDNSAPSMVLYDAATDEIFDGGTSSIHFKENVENLVFDTTAFLNLRPVAFNWREARGGKPDVGLIAQEVADVFPELSYKSYKMTHFEDGSVLRDSLGLPIVDSTQLEVSGVRYHKIPVYLLAVARKQQREMLELREAISGLQEALQSCCGSDPQMRLNNEELNQHSPIGMERVASEFILLANDPNPFRDYTDINYAISDCSQCFILITDMNGRIVKRIPLTSNKGSVRVFSSEIGSGLFNYSIIDNGVVIKSAKMVSSR